MSLTRCGVVPLEAVSPQCQCPPSCRSSAEVRSILSDLIVYRARAEALATLSGSFDRRQSVPRCWTEALPAVLPFFSSCGDVAATPPELLARICRLPFRIIKTVLHLCAKPRRRIPPQAVRPAVAIWPAVGASSGILCIIVLFFRPAFSTAPSSAAATGFVLCALDTPLPPGHLTASCLW